MKDSQRKAMFAKGQNIRLSDLKGKDRWNGMTYEQKVNHYSSYTGITPEHVDMGGFTYSMLPKYAKKALDDSYE